VPLLIEHATTERQRRIVDVVLGRQAMDWPVVAPPGLPEDRKQALRRAFDATMTDPEYLAEAIARRRNEMTLGELGAYRLRACRL
jgi:hypothetical protein